MKAFRTTVLIAASLLASAVALAQDITTMGKGEFDLDAYQGKKIHVEFVESNRFTQLISTRFESLGFKVVAKPEEADLRFQVSAGYSFKLPHGKSSYIEFGKVLDAQNTDAVKAKAENADGASKINIPFTVDSLKGNVSTGAFLGVGLVTSLLEMTGAKSWLNKKLVGDARGVCLGTEKMCENWNRYDQSMRLLVYLGHDEREFRKKPITIGVGAHLKGFDLVPESLLDVAFAQ